MNSIEQPTAGFYRMRMVRGGPLVGVRIWFGLPLEPWTREEMDRAPRWNADMNGRWIDLERVWPACMKDPVDEAEYRHLSGLSGWARENDGYDPMGQPFKRTNWADSTPPSF